ncbi:glycosyltransferase [Solibacillus silvestris]
MKFTGERFIPTVVDTDDEIKIEHMQRYYAIQNIVEGKVVLDAACGEGYGTNMLSEYALKVYGLDIDKETIEHAKKKYTKSNIEYQQGSIEELPFPNDYFDVVVSFETIEHVSGDIQAKFLKEIKRVLKADGTLIMSTPNKKIYSDYRNYKNPFHVKEFYKDEYYTFLKSAFKEVKFYYQYRENVFLLTGEDSDNIETLKLNTKTSENSKYFVAICSDKVENNYHVSAAHIENGTFNKKMERITTLQNDVVERNNHITKLDIEIEEKNNYINVMQDNFAEKNNYILQLDKALNNQNEQINELTKTLEENNILLENLIEENKLLKEKEKQLKNIFESDGWKMLLRYYRIRDKIFNPNGKIRFFAKMAKRVIFDRNFKMINKENIKKFRYYYKNQELSMLENRVDNFIERNTNTASPLKLEIEELDKNYDKLIFTSFDKPKVSIVIPVYNQWHYTYACLKSILTHTHNVAYEVIIADDMSSDETVTAEQYVENVKVVRDGINRGFVLNCNNSAQHAQGEYIYFLNNDTQVQESWLESLVELIESDETIGMVGSKLVYPDGRLQEAGGIIWDDASGWNYGRLDDPNKSEYSYVKEVDYISGAGIMIRGSLWKELGGFDERYAPAYYEDTDLAFEVRKHGYKVMLNPKSVVVHFEGISHGKDENSKAQEYQKKNKELFLAKWKKELSEFHFKNSENVFVARDRSRNKKTIVVIDHYVPHFDRDAGSRCTYSYLKLFVKMGYKVVFIGDNFYKHEPYTSDLQARGIEVLYGDEYAQNIEKWFKDNKDFINYVYLNRPHISIKYIDMVKKHTDAKILYFGHDLHYLRELRNYEIEKNPELLKSSAKWKEIEFELFNKADVVHVVGSYEQEVLMQELGDKPIRNIPLFMFSEEEYKPLTLDFNERKDILFVGGFNHKPNYDGVLWFLNEVFPNIKEKNPEMKFYIVGSNPPDDIQRLQSDDIIVTGYVTDEQLEQYYKKSRVVVVPLRYGAGVKGKVVEAIYHQVPIVTTDIGAEGLKDIEQAVLIAITSDEFSALTIDLYNDENNWNTLATNSEQYIKEHFSIEAAIKQIKQDIH